MTRPLLHLTAERGWLNDPHGVVVHDGRFHLFHQHVPDGVAWAPGCHWAHAVGDDLLTWAHRPVALAPGDGDDGVWTGGLALDGDDARIFYTSVAEPDLGLGRVRVARPGDPAWDTWTKGEVVVEPPDHLDLVAFRDPVVVREDDGWRMFVAGSTGDGEALLLTWTSADLRGWREDGVALRRSSAETEPVWTGSLWECPQLFEVDGHPALLFSVWHDDVTHHAAFAVGGPGSYDAGRFRPESWNRLSHGDSYYAPTFFRDREGRPCALFWMRGVVDPAGEWAGCLSVPHLLSVRGGRLVAEPHPAVAGARDVALPEGTPARAFDLEWEPDAGDAVDLSGATGPTASLVAGDGVVALERPGTERWTMPWDGEPLQVVVDGSVVEVTSARGLLGGPVGVTTTWTARRVSGRPPRAWTLVP